MQTKILSVVVACCFIFCLQAQTEANDGYRNFPIVLTLQFHSLSLPFKDFKSNFSNIGFGLGTEVSLNRKDTWVQQVSAVWYRNKAVGNGLLFYTQTAWRPNLFSNVFTEVKAGVGYLYAFRPVTSFKPVNGSWEMVGRKGKGMLAIPTGVSLGFDAPASGKYLYSPFASYQFLILNGYNKSIPVVPETLFQVGSRIQLNDR